MTRSATAEPVLPPSTQSAPPVAGNPGASGQISIAPTGKRKMKFNGREVARVANRAADNPVWHEITLYLRDRGGAVLALRTARSEQPGDEIVAVWRADSASAALDELDAYDAGSDVPVATDQDDTGLCPAEMAAAALHLRAQVESTRNRFARLRSELVEQMEATGIL